MKAHRRINGLDELRNTMEMPGTGLERAQPRNRKSSLCKGNEGSASLAGLPFYMGT